MEDQRTNPYYQAQAILSRRDYSASELSSKLSRKGFSSEQVASAIEKLESLGLINDGAYAAQYINGILLSKPVGPRWISHKLKAKGISESTISIALDEAFSNQPEEELALKAALKWQRINPNKAEDRIKLTNFLTSRGFSFIAISQAIENSKENQTD